MIPEDLCAALDELARFGILRWEPHPDGISTQLLALAPGEGTRLLLSPDARSLWRAIVQIEMAFDRTRGMAAAERN
jgi:hypothetical protein